MKITFKKYQGTGNDFIIIDNRNLTFPKNDFDLIQNLCHRHFGIGGDGLMLLESSEKHDFVMIYYNSDGKEGSMCGNGGRCIAAFAHQLGIFEKDCSFEAADGVHYASVVGGTVHLKMSDVKIIEDHDSHYFLDTGSPHHIKFEETIKDLDVYGLGKAIRYGSPYFQKGANVNFVEIVNAQKIKVRTYERGVENETLSCGTGVTASAIATYISGKSRHNSITIETLGGNLNVSFKQENDQFKEIVLTGPATFVFEGEIQIN